MSVLDKRVLQLTELFDSFLTLSNVHTVGSSFDAICPNIFVGTRDFAKDVWHLKQLGVTHVLNVCNDLKHTDRDRFDTSNIMLAHVSFKDVERRKKDCQYLFRITSGFVRKALSSGGKVLIYSLLGVNQAPAVIIAYFVDTYRLCVERAALVVAMNFLLRQLIRLSDDTLRKRPKNDHIARPIDQNGRLKNALNFVNGVGIRRPVREVKGARMIIFNLFVGTIDVASDVMQIAKHHISHIFDLSGNDHDNARYPELQVTSIGPFQNVSFNLEALIEICVTFIGDRLKGGERILVLGKENESLADAVIAAYIMESHAVNVEEALYAITERRCVYLGVNYLKFLFYYEGKLRRRKQKTLQQLSHDTFYSFHCDTSLLEDVNRLCFLNVRKETSV